MEQARETVNRGLMSVQTKQSVPKQRVMAQAAHKVLAVFAALALAVMPLNLDVALAADGQSGADEGASAQSAKLAAGVYTITANLTMPGQYNPVLPNTAVYANNPNNPFADKAGNKPVLDGNSADDVEAVAPTTPLSANATLTVAADGTKTLELPILNPVFTTQDLGTCSELPDVKVETKAPADTSVWTYGSYSTRICKITTTLTDTLQSGTATYNFKGSKLYAVPLNMDIAPSGDIALQLTVDYSTAVKTADLPDGGKDSGQDKGNTGTDTGKGDSGKSDSGSGDAGTGGSDNSGSDNSGSNTGQNADKGNTGTDTVTKINKPSAITGLTYNGQEQTGVVSKVGYTLANATATDAGTYTATATLNKGYEWSDGSTGAVEVKWTIAKALLTATYIDETITVGQTPALKTKLTGFVNGETESTAKSLTMPSVSAPSTMTAGKTYTLYPTRGKAANYKFTYVAGELKVNAAAAESALAAGTYTITANLSMPGEYNPVLINTTVYANNPDNPFGIIEDSTIGADGNTAPTTPLSMNATMVVGSDGTKTLILPILNPVFTTQALGTCSELTDVWVERKATVDMTADNASAGHKYATRISKLGATLSDTQDAGVKTYTFKGSMLYAQPLNLEIAPDGDVALELTVDYDSATKTSDSTELSFAKTNDSGASVEGSSANERNTNSGSNNSGSNGSNGSATSNNTSNTNNSNGGSTNTDLIAQYTQQAAAATTTANAGNSATVNRSANASATHIAAGTYTVSANLWFDKSETGLPLNPHMTNGGFPPSTPVSDNATLTVDSSGHAVVKAPVLIQDKVMTINNVWGDGISYDGSTVTIDLGYPSSTDSTFTGTCSTSVTIGWLAQTIAAGIFNGVWDHTWVTNWQVNLGSDLPSSGNDGSLPEAAKAILNGENGTTDEASATEAALAAVDAALADAGGVGGSGSGTTGTSKSASSHSGVAGAVEDLQEQMSQNPWLGFALGAGTTVVVGGAAAGGTYAYKRKKKNSSAEGEDQKAQGAEGDGSLEMEGNAHNAE